MEQAEWLTILEQDHDNVGLPCTGASKRMMLRLLRASVVRSGASGICAATWPRADAGWRLLFLPRFRIVDFGEGGDPKSQLIYTPK